MGTRMVLLLARRIAVSEGYPWGGNCERLPMPMERVTWQLLGLDRLQPCRLDFGRL